MSFRFLPITLQWRYFLTRQEAVFHFKLKIIWHCSFFVLFCSFNVFFSLVLTFSNENFFDKKNVMVFLAKHGSFVLIRRSYLSWTESAQETCMKLHEAILYNLFRVSRSLGFLKWLKQFWELLFIQISRSSTRNAFEFHE